MLLILAALGIGLLIGSFHWLPAGTQIWTGRLVNGTLIFLLFCIGAKIGSHEQVLHHLDRLGLAAAGLALATTTASAAAAWVWSRYLA